MNAKITYGYSRPYHSNSRTGRRRGPITVIPPEKRHAKVSDIDAPLLRTFDPVLEPCVYFLILGTSVVYVGQSVNLGARISQHYKDGKRFDSVRYIPCRQNDMAQIEHHWISRLLPILNQIEGPQSGGARMVPQDNDAGRPDIAAHFMTTAEAMAILRYKNRSAFFQIVYAHGIPHTRIGRRKIMFPRAALADWLAQKSVGYTRRDGLGERLGWLR